MIAHCPSCNFKKELPAGFSGKTAKCSKCGTVFTIEPGTVNSGGGSGTAVIILSVLCVLLAAGLAFMLFMPEDTTQKDRADHLESRVEQLNTKLREAEEEMRAESRRASEAVGNLAGVRNLLEAKTEGLNQAESEIEKLKAELESLKNSGGKTTSEQSVEQKSPPKTEAGDKDSAEDSSEDQAQNREQDTAPVSPSEVPVLSEIHTLSPAQPPLPKSAPAPTPTPIGFKKSSEPAEDGPDLKEVQTISPDAAMPGGLMKHKRDNPELFSTEIVMTNQGAMPRGAFDAQNKQLKKAGKPLLVIVEETSLPVSNAEASSPGATDRAPGVLPPSEVKTAIEKKLPDAPATLPPGLVPDSEPDSQSMENDTNADKAENDIPLYTVDTTINVRSDRTTDSEVVFKLRPGQAVRLGFLEDNWYAVFKPEVDASIEDNALGYVYAPLFDDE